MNVGPEEPSNAAQPAETPEELDHELDVALADTFPASDPVGGLANVEATLPLRKHPPAD